MNDKKSTKNESLDQDQEHVAEVEVEVEVEAEAEAEAEVEAALIADKGPGLASSRILVSSTAAFCLGAVLFLAMALQVSNKVGQVDDMLIALTKRAVNMNTAISSFEELNVTIQEMGDIQEQFLDQQNLLLIAVKEIKTQIPAEAAQKVAKQNAAVGLKINQLENTLNKQNLTIANVTKSMVGLSSRIEKFEERLVDVKRLTEDVDALVTLEREDYLEVLKRQAILQEAQGGKQIVKVPRDPDLIFYSIKTP